MIKVTLTCPFTGCEFEAEQPDFNTLLFTHPLTNESFELNISPMDSLTIPAELFDHIETVSLSEAAKILNVSRQRVSAIASKNVIPSKIVNNQTVFLLSDVIEYKRNRKPGAPRKA